MRLLLVLSVVAACASQPRCPIEQPIAQGQPFLWKASKGGDIVWLYGTIHDAGDPDVFREHARIEKGKGIDQLLPTDDWWDLRDALLGKIKEDDLRRVRPWYAMSLLTSAFSPTPGPSMDSELTDRARELAKPIEALETWQDQLALLDRVIGIPDLQEAIHARKTMRCDLTRMLGAYRAGDLVTMQALLVVPRTEETLLTARNRAWFPQIEKQFAQGGAFVAVGLGHLLGDNGLVIMLQHAGYTVERVAR